MIEIADHTSGFPVLPVEPPTAIKVFDKKIFCSLISMKQTHPATAFCFGNLLDKRRTSSTLCYGDSYVIHSRNSIADAFLSTDCEYLFSLDDDTIVPFANAKWYKAYSTWDWYPEEFASLNTLDQLVSRKKSVIGALYFGRWRHGRPTFSEGGHVDMEKLARTAPMDKVFKTDWVGTGAILIHRNVFLDIEKKFPRLARGLDGKGGQWFTPSEHDLMQSLDNMRKMLSEGPMTGQKAMKAYEMAEAMSLQAKKESGLGTGEDVAFSRRARQAGHDVWVDFSIVAGHFGPLCYGPRNTAPRPDEKNRSL